MIPGIYYLWYIYQIYLKYTAAVNNSNIATQAVPPPARRSHTTHHMVLLMYAVSWHTRTERRRAGAVQLLRDMPRPQVQHARHMPHANMQHCATSVTHAAKIQTPHPTSHPHRSHYGILVLKKHYWHVNKKLVHIQYVRHDMIRCTRYLLQNTQRIIRIIRISRIIAT